MITKEKLIDVIKTLPEDFSIDDLLDKILLMQKIDAGLEQSNNDDVISDEELDRELPGWLS